MREYLAENRAFILLCLGWLLVGIYAGPVMYGVLPVTLFLLHKRGYYKEVFIGFIFVLTMSDSRLREMSWAADLKNVYIVLFALFSLQCYYEQDFKVRFHLYILPFILISCISIFFSPQLIVAVQKTVSYFLMAFAAPNYFLYTYRRYGLKFIKEIIYFMSLLLLIGLVLHVLSPGITTLVGRYRGLLGNPNGIGIYCFLFFAFIIIATELFPSLLSFYEKVFILGLVLFSLVLCGARSSLLASLIFLGYRRFNKVSPVLGFMVLLIIIVGYELISTNLVSIIQTFGLERYARVETLESGSGRLVAWRFALEQIDKNFFLGRGFNYTEYIFGVYEKKLSMMGHQGAAHNAYLTFWLNTGIIGLAAFAIGFVAFVFSISRYSISVIALLFAVLFSNQFESWLTASLNPFTIIMLSSFTMVIVAGMGISEVDPEQEPAVESELQVQSA